MFKVFALSDFQAGKSPCESQNQGEENVELLFNRQAPCMHKGLQFFCVAPIAVSLQNSILEEKQGTAARLLE